MSRLTWRAYGRTVSVRGPSVLLALLEAAAPPSYQLCPPLVPDREWEVAATGSELPLGDARQVMSEVGLWVAEHAVGVVFVHAGCVAVGGRALLLPGPSRSGKSTLTAALVRAGATYYSDEYAVLLPGGHVLPYARPLYLRGSDGEFTSATPVGELGGQAGDGPCPVGLVATLCFSGEWAVATATATDCALSLVRNCVPARVRPREALEAVLSAVREARGLEGTRGEPGPAAASLLSLLS